MKNKSIFWSIIILLMMIVSCKPKIAVKEEKVLDSRMNVKMERSPQDTVALRSLATSYLGLLKEGKIDEALSMLKEIKGDSVCELPKEKLVQFKQMCSAFPVVTFSVDTLLLYSEHDTEIRYTTTFFEKALGDDRPNAMKFVLNPCRIQGKWYLGCFDKSRNNNSQNN